MQDLVLEKGSSHNNHFVAEGRCPNCGASEIDYKGSMELEDRMVYYPWECSNCKAVGKEWYNLVFDGHSLPQAEQEKPFELLGDARRLDMLVGALEGGSNYWYFMKLEEGIDLKAYSKEGEATSTADRIWRALLDGKVFKIHDGEDEDNELGDLSLEGIKEGEKLMYREEPSHFADILSESDDATTADVWFQYAVLKELTYG